MVVLTSPRIVKEVLDLRGSSTADRPDTHIGSIVTGGLDITIAHHGPAWKKMRRALHDVLTKEACMNHLPIQRAEATQLMYDLLVTPERFYTHLRRYASSVIMCVSFGIHCDRYEHPYIEDFYDTLRKWEALMGPGGHPPVDMFPILKYVPERWAKWKSVSREIRDNQTKLRYALMDACTRRIKDDRRNGCFLEHILDHQQEYGLTDEMVGHVGSALMQAGADTTAVYLQMFVLCMIAHPEIQRRAQKEIDSVIGKDRTPVFDDINDLPYVRAIIDEVHRFRPITPTALPHKAMEDERVDNYLLPKGALIFMNTWGIYHDDNLFENPDIFNPDRFLRSEFGTKPGVDISNFRNDLVFGAGRRICPGSHLATNSIILNVMNLLWAFELSSPKDPNTGESTPVDLNDLTTGVLIMPKPFKCQITPRSETRAELIRTEFAEAKATFSCFEHDLVTMQT
ncbi:cytochrome P450 [Panus rudis PR-1116 ss-1]|nr:cytochrome P450 [Panus rudis PR-1116 ss-1]